MSTDDEELLNLAYQIKVKEEELLRLKSQWSTAIAGLRNGSVQKVVAKQPGLPTLVVPVPAPVIESFENSANENGERSNPELVMDFLRKHPGKAFTVAEIAKAIGRADKLTTLRNTIQRLQDKEQIESEDRGTYRIVSVEAG